MELIFKHKERLPYGSNSRGKFIPPENGRRAIFVPSFGVLEKEEVDYLVEASQEQEDDRIRKDKTSDQKKQLEEVTEAVLKAPAGKRAALARELAKGGTRWA